MIRSFRLKNLIVIEFPTIDEMRQASFRYAFYPDQTKPHFLKELKTEQTWGFFSQDATDFTRRVKLDQPTREEYLFQRRIARLTKGRYSKYSLIVIPKYLHIETFHHEMAHFLCSHYRSFRREAGKIVGQFVGLDKIKSYTKEFNNYQDNEVVEECIAYLCHDDLSFKIPYRTVNTGKINKIKRLYSVYLSRFLGEEPVESFYPLR